MDRSKIVVIAIVVIILAGAGAWSWVNTFQIPEYNPEQAELFADYFYIRCETESPSKMCNETIGHYHRECFIDQIESIDGPPGDDETDTRRRRGYLDCMDRAHEQRLSGETQ